MRFIFITKVIHFFPEPAVDAKWEKLTGYCLTQYFVDNFFSLDLKEWSPENSGYVYPVTLEDCKSRCESMDRETNPCNGFKMTTVQGEGCGGSCAGFCTGTYKDASNIKRDHLVACTSPDCGECDGSVMSAWEYWTWEQPNKCKIAAILNIMIKFQ